MAKPKTRTGAKPGTSAELAEMFPVSRKIPVRVKRVTGEGEARTVVWESRVVIVEPMVIGQMGRITALLAPISESLDTAPNFITLAAAHPEVLLGATAEAIEWDVAELSLVHAADFVTLARAIFEDNRDFFDRLLGPLVSGIQAMIKAAVNGVGPTLSPSSSATATPNPRPTH